MEYERLHLLNTDTYEFSRCVAQDVWLSLVEMLMAYTYSCSQLNVIMRSIDGEFYLLQRDPALITFSILMYIS